ncbi:RDD family protein [Nocardia callitridis]
MLGAVLDGLLALLIGLGLTQRVFPDADGALAVFAGLVGCALPLSFLNHVVGAVLFRTTAAKFLLGMRVVRWRDGKRPRFGQAMRRWLLGFVLVVFQPMLEGTLPEACGLRTVLRRDLARGITV